MIPYTPIVGSGLVVYDQSDSITQYDPPYIYTSRRRTFNRGLLKGRDGRILMCDSLRLIVDISGGFYKYLVNDTYCYGGEVSVRIRELRTVVRVSVVEIYNTADKDGIFSVYPRNANGSSAGARKKGSRTNDVIFIVSIVEGRYLDCE